MRNATRTFKMSDSNGKRFLVVASNSAEAILKVRKLSTAKTVYTNC